MKRGLIVTTKTLDQEATSPIWLQKSRLQFIGKGFHKLTYYSMGAKTNLENGRLNVPGAGSYDLPSKIVESPGKTIGQKLDITSLAGKLGPGPGGYNVDK
jgi:hypothetical protein